MNIYISRFFLTFLLCFESGDYFYFQSYYNLKIMLIYHSLWQTSLKNNLNISIIWMDTWPVVKTVPFEVSDYWKSMKLLKNDWTLIEKVLSWKLVVICYLFLIGVLATNGNNRIRKFELKSTWNPVRTQQKTVRWHATRNTSIQHNRKCVTRGNKYTM